MPTSQHVGLVLPSGRSWFNSRFDFNDLSIFDRVNPREDGASVRLRVEFNGAIPNDFACVDRIHGHKRFANIYAGYILLLIQRMTNAFGHDVHSIHDLYLPDVLL